MLITMITDNEEVSIFWVGLGASPQQINDLFGVDDILDLSPNLVRPSHHPSSRSWLM